MEKNIIAPLLPLWMVPLDSHANIPDHVQKTGHFVSKPRHVLSRMLLNALARTPLGGIDQWLFVQGQKESNPVLLFLHGGPGAPIIPSPLAISGQLSSSKPGAFSPNRHTDCLHSQLVICECSQLYGGERS